MLNSHCMWTPNQTFVYCREHNAAFTGNSVLGVVSAHYCFTTIWFFLLVFLFFPEWRFPFLLWFVILFLFIHFLTVLLWELTHNFLCFTWRITAGMLHTPSSFWISNFRTFLRSLLGTWCDTSVQQLKDTRNKVASDVWTTTNAKAAKRVTSFKSIPSNCCSTY